MKKINCLVVTLAILVSSSSYASKPASLEAADTSKPAKKTNPKMSAQAMQNQAQMAMYMNQMNRVEQVLSSLEVLRKENASIDERMAKAGPLQKLQNQKLRAKKSQNEARIAKFQKELEFLKTHRVMPPRFSKAPASNTKKTQTK